MRDKTRRTPPWHALPVRLVGRKAERAVLDGVAARLHSGASEVLVLRGEAGVGKSALLRYLAGQLGSCRLVAAAGAESELELAYSGLHQLCAPVLELRERLPEPQRNALETVFGLSAGAPPNRFLVGLATLTLLSEAAEERPLVCLVDDAQWLDTASAQVIGFVARRLLAERVGLVCAARTGTGDEALAGLPALQVDGLADEDARKLLLANVYGPLDPAIRERIVAESRGNPLALLELPRTWPAGIVAADGEPVAGRIEQSYAERIAALPPDARLLLLAAAADPLGDPGLLRRAVSALDLDPAAADPAVDAGLIQLRPGIEFAHPLVRSATYRTASPADRSRVHHALAESTDPGTDPDRRSWHRAQAAAGPDESVAAELERSAARAHARGGLAASAAFLAAAARLTPDSRERARRAIEAGSANARAGALDVARDMLAIAASTPSDELHEAQLDLARAQLTFMSSRGNDGLPMLLAAAERLHPLDPALARETYVDAFTAAMFGSRLNAGVNVSDVARAARSAERPAGEATMPDLILNALVGLADVYAAPVVPSPDSVERVRDAVRRIRDLETVPDDKLRWLWHASVFALELSDDEGACILSERYLDSARRSGALSEMTLALTVRIPVLVFCGELGAAESLVAESRSIENATGIKSAPYGALIAGGWRGRTADTGKLVASTARTATARGEGAAFAVGDYSRAVLCNAAGDYAQGLDAARAASEHREIALENWCLAELVESASRTGRSALAGPALERLSSKAAASGTDWARGVAARSRALLSDADDAERFFREALSRLGRTRVRAELARTHLLYGEWLRRAGRRIDARRELGTAEELFTAMGAETFAERAQRELLATGATARKRDTGAPDDLTPTEAQIGFLARDGLSNAEIAAQLFLSPRTVEWHLGNIFAKLGITRRRQLAGTLRDNRRSLAETAS